MTLDQLMDEAMTKYYAGRHRARPTLKKEITRWLTSRSTAQAASPAHASPASSA